MRDRIPLLIALVLFSSCARQEVMTNTFLASPAVQDAVVPSASFAVLPNPGSPNPIFDQTVKEKIEFMLESSGYRLEAPENADYHVQYAYGIEETTAVRPLVLPRRRSFYARGSRYYDPFWDDGFGTTRYVHEPYTLYIARMNLSAFGKDAAGARRAVWVGETMTESLEPDMRKLVDYLLTASFRYFMKDTGRNRNVVIGGGNDTVENLRAVSGTGGREAFPPTTPQAAPAV